MSEIENKDEEEQEVLVPDAIFPAGYIARPDETIDTKGNPIRFVFY